METIQIPPLEIEAAKSAYSRFKVFEKMDHLLDQVSSSDLEDMMTADCILHCMQNKKETQDYEALAAMAKKLGYDKVFDIGACTGVQELYFQALELDYSGIEITKKPRIYSDSVRYETSYPCRIKDQKDALLISNLCIGYLIDLIESLPFMAQDFNACLMNCPKLTQEEAESAEKWFKITRLQTEEGRYFTYMEKRGTKNE